MENASFCDKTGHRAKDCRKRQDQENSFKEPKHAQVHVIEIEHLSHDVGELNLSVVVFEVNMVGDNSKEWWVDTGAT